MPPQICTGGAKVRIRRDLLLKFCDAFYISRTAKATKYKLYIWGMQIDYKEYFRTGDIEKLAAFDIDR